MTPERSWEGKQGGWSGARVRVTGKSSDYIRLRIYYHGAWSRDLGISFLYFYIPSSLLTILTEMAENQSQGNLQVLNPSVSHTFKIPLKCINEGEDVQFWLTTWAYTDLMSFLLQLNASVFPRRTETGFQAWKLDYEDFAPSDTVKSLKVLIEKLIRILDEVPPDPGPRRFGNVSFRKWYDLVEERADTLLDQHLPRQVLDFRTGQSSNAEEKTVTARDELRSYFLGSFGSAQRLDYGTGHELSFIAFLGGIWKLGGFMDGTEGEWGSEERGIVIGVIEPCVSRVLRLHAPTISNHYLSDTFIWSAD